MEDESNLFYQTANKESDKNNPFAVIKGSPVTELPQDLYIPPDALEVFLEAFEGPLDLLLYLIKKQNLDILDIPIAKITEQYMTYIGLMGILRLGLISEYLLMAAMLAEIKSRMLLPRSIDKEDEEDPRAELIRRLQEYESYKKSAEELDSLPRSERDLYPITLTNSNINKQKKEVEVSMDAILHAFSNILKRADFLTGHKIKRETLSVRERMTIVLEKINSESFTDFVNLFSVEEGRAGLIVSFLAILQLLKESLIEIAQNEINGTIYIKASS